MSEFEATLPSEQHAFDGLRALDERTLYDRRERVFLVLSGIFLGTLAMLNILGVTRFIDLSFTIPLVQWKVPMALAVGVLPYPITFLCTDFLSELYGQKRTNQVVWVGLLLNIWIAVILWVGGVVPAAGPPPSPDADPNVFMEVRRFAMASISASMIAYLAAQLVDVHVFHFWKRLTNGKHLWLRNNGSTLVSQMVDSVAVILITHFTVGGLPIRDGESLWPQLWVLVLSSYVFKMLTALLDTGPFYIGTYHLNRYLRLRPAGQMP